ncbi:MAG: serine hydrolase domain-containing protein [Xanthomonadales bacterium]|nr:serine hydrolase domain-containing protein [Xanthomonadales bacterium]
MDRTFILCLAMLYPLPGALVSDNETSPLKPLTDLMEDAEIPGLSVVRINDGDIEWSYALGVKEVNSEEPVTESTVFEAASLSKPVVAYLTLRLAARGVIDLDAPLWDKQGYDRLAHDPRARDITTRMVLTHTSGLPNWGGTPLNLNNDPGSTWGYSGEGFVYLATMLERRTGKLLNQLAREEVFEPLEMPSSSFVWTEAYEQTAASPHDLGGQSTEKGRPESANAAASLHTTARDYGRFLIAVMKGEGLPDDLAMAMVSQQSDIGGWGDKSTWEHLGWTLGWGYQKGDGGGAIWHWGDNGNFRCFVLAYPERREALVYFSNTSLGLSIADDMLELAFDDTFWALRYLDYYRWDAPGYQARKALRQVAVESSEDEALESVKKILAELPEDVAGNEALRVGSFLVERGNLALAGSVADWGVERFGGVQWLEGRAEIRTRTKDHAGAVADFEAALALDGERSEAIAPRLAWLKDGLKSAGKNYQLAADGLDEYVGTFGPRVIRRENLRLLYRREGASSESPLLPLDQDVFVIEGVHWFRMRFDRDETGEVIGITGLYWDGRTDETLRSE